jgi:hypothetical protein
MTTEMQKQWMAAWRIAGPELERIRNEELRRLDENAVAKTTSKMHWEQAQFSGLAIFQAWMMRLRVLDLLKNKHA